MVVVTLLGLGGTGNRKSFVSSKSSHTTPRRAPACKLSALTLGVLLIAAGCDRPTPPPVPPATACTTDPAGDVDWFNNGLGVAPADNEIRFNSNCAFHQWSWQSFLWFVRERDSKPLFMTLKRPGDIYPNWGTVERTPDGEMVVLNVRIPKSAKTRSFAEIRQALSDGLLTDQNGRAVYYTMHMNDVFVDFVTNNRLNEPSVYAGTSPAVAFKNNGEGSGLAMPDGTNAVELKASWKIMGPGDDPAAFFTVPAVVNKLTTDAAGNVVVDPDATEQVTAGLVGFHIAGAPEGHPEMIWATFEHVDNAPDVPFDIVTEMSKPKTPGQEKALLETVIAKRDFSFYKAGTQFQSCNLNPDSMQLSDQKLSPITQVCRLYPTGGSNPDQPQDKGNHDNIVSLNASVWTAVTGSAASPLVRKYREIGAIWFLDPETQLVPDSKLQDPAGLTGSTHLSNATIETFTQLTDTADNCFTCHNTLQEFPPAFALEAGVDALPGMNLNISHILKVGYFREAVAAAD